MAPRKTSTKRAAPRSRREPEPERAPEREPERRDNRGRNGDDDRDGGRGGSYGRGSGGSRRSNSDLARLGGLWAKRTKKGDRMFSGLVTVGDFLDYIERYRLQPGDRASLLILMNTYKKEDRHPDFNIFGTDPHWKGKGRRSGGDRDRGRDDDRERNDDRAPRRDDREREPRGGGDDDGYNAL